MALAAIFALEASQDVGANANIAAKAIKNMI